jgi:hypothetical protein
MIVAGKSPFNGGDAAIRARYPHLLTEIEQVIAAVKAEEHKTKESIEKTMLGRMLYSPSSLNRAFKEALNAMDWSSRKVWCEYHTEFYTEGYKASVLNKGAFREMDFVKEKLGVEVQFCKYAFMVYNVCAKMTIFRNLGIIDTGIEIVPVKQFADQMSTGVSYFEQIVWDLLARGTADIDVPVLILGIDV